MGKRAKEKKSAWLSKITTKDNPGGLIAAVCETCRLWVIETRDNCEWAKWDAGVISGDDITIAIILGKPLAHIEAVPCTGQASLRTVLGPIGLDPGGQYLALHECFHGRISDRPWTPPKRPKQPSLAFLKAYDRGPKDYTDPWANDPPENSLF